MATRIVPPSPRTACLALLVLCACTGGPAEWLRRPPAPVQWPPAPQPARVDVDCVYHGSDDIDTHPGLLRRMFAWAVGDDVQELAMPCGIALAADGTMFVADTARGCVHRIDGGDGAHTLLVGSEDVPLATPIGVALGADGLLFVSDSTNGCIAVFAGDRAVRALGRGTLQRPTGIAWDQSRQRLLVVDTLAGCVVALAPDGRELLRSGRPGTGMGEFNHPTNLAIARDGAVLVTDSMNFRVQELDQDLRPVRAFGHAGRGPGTFASPKGLALDADDHVWVVDALFDNVQVFTRDGALLLAVGESGTDFGGLHLPSGICIDADGRVVVADAGNARIQVLRYHSRP